MEGAHIETIKRMLDKLGKSLENLGFRFDVDIEVGWKIYWSIRKQRFFFMHRHTRKVQWEFPCKKRKKQTINQEPCHHSLTTKNKATVLNRKRSHVEKPGVH